MSEFSSNLIISDTDDENNEDSELKVESPPKKIKLQPHFVEKFNLLKEKRLKLEKRNEKRRVKNKSKSNNNNTIKQVNKNTNSILDSVKAFTLAPDLKQLLPSVKCLEKSLDKALGEANIEQAEKISDDILTKQTQMKLIENKEQIEFDEEKRRRLEEKEKRGRTSRLTWRFEAKQRWETKSNM